MKLCGHATLAAAHILFGSSVTDSSTIQFVSLSGVLIAKRVPETTNNGNKSFSIELDFPTTDILHCDNPDNDLISKALNGAPFVEVKTTFPENDLLVLRYTTSILFISPVRHEQEMSAYSLFCCRLCFQQERMWRG